MDTDIPESPADLGCSRPSLQLSFLSFLAIPVVGFILLGGCASPGEPIERKAPVPEPVKDLAAAQSGNDVVLTFSLPTEAIDHRQLEQTPTVEIYRNFIAPTVTSANASSSPPVPALLVTMPASVVEQYMRRGGVRYSDSLKADDFAQHPNAAIEYVVRTRESEKKSSPDSNLAMIPVYPAPLPISDVKTVFDRTSVNLTWTPPQKTPIGDTPPITSYRIYRGEVEGGNEAGTIVSNADLKLKTALLKIGDSNSPSYRDADALLDARYAYSVRSVVQYSGATIESSDSNFAIITPRDLFPPAAPQGLLVVPIPAQGDTPAHLEISWAISPEPDIAGYNVYRSDSQGTRGARQNQDLLLTPAFRDISLAPGKHYFYSVTAVDRSGNESIASDVATGDLPAQQ